MDLADHKVLVWLSRAPGKRSWRPPPEWKSRGYAHVISGHIFTARIAQDSGAKAYNPGILFTLKFTWKALDIFHPSGVSPQEEITSAKPEAGMIAANATAPTSIIAKIKDNNAAIEVWNPTGCRQIY